VPLASGSMPERTSRPSSSRTLRTGKTWPRQSFSSMCSTSTGTPLLTNIDTSEMACERCACLGRNEYDMGESFCEHCGSVGNECCDGSLWS